MEGDDELPSEYTKSAEKSFCGSYSAKNLATAYDDSKKPIRLSVNKHVSRSNLFTCSPAWTWTSF